MRNLTFIVPACHHGFKPSDNFADRFFYSLIACLFTVQVDEDKGYTDSTAFKGCVQTGFAEPVGFPHPSLNQVTVDGMPEGPFGNSEHNLNGVRKGIGTFEPYNPEKPGIKGMTAVKEFSNPFVAA